MIAIVDYGAGNVRSVQKALAFVGADARLTSDPAEILSASRVVFPGQGHFGQSMGQLRQTGLDQVLIDVAQRGTPFLGICLGLQLLFEASDEAPGVAGLGLLKGHCERFAHPRKTPQIGWNQVQVQTPGSCIDPVLSAGDDHFYFVHTFHAVAADPSQVAATADYDGPFTAAVRQGALFAAQFHPEKSGHAGLNLLQSWLREDASC
ncbi:MAG: imidazole glycerol phosphate synthase subunit HisH [Myxococcales bacterium]|nr:imidazole glycerol phosphate synthase subunit HisH [Myxococcales bacterium]